MRAFKGSRPVVRPGITQRPRAHACRKGGPKRRCDTRSCNAPTSRTNIDLNNFIYTASHDLKSPITNRMGLLYELRAQLPEPRAAAAPGGAAAGYERFGDLLLAH